MEEKKGKYYYPEEFDESKVILPELDDLLPQKIHKHFYDGLRVWVGAYQKEKQRRETLISMNVERAEADKLLSSLETVLDFLKDGGMPMRLVNHIWTESAIEHMENSKLEEIIDDYDDFIEIEELLTRLNTDLKKLREYASNAQSKLKEEKGNAGRPKQEVRDMVLYYVYWRLLQGGVKTKGQAMRDAAKILIRCGIPAPGGASSRIAEDNISKRIRSIEEYYGYKKSPSKKAIK